jgi:cystathionine beta-synthase
MARRLTREEGLFVGGSSGLITHVALQVAREIDDPDAMVVTFLCDTGERYLTKLYSDEWMRENQLLDEPDRVRLSQLLGAKGVSAPALVSVGPGSTVRQALRLMDLHDISQLPVMEGDNCVGSVTDSALSARSLADTKMLDAVVSDVMEAPFPIVDGGQTVEGIAKLLSKANPAVLVRGEGRMRGIVTRSDVLNHLMSR